MVNLITLRFKRSCFGGELGVGFNQLLSRQILLFLSLSLSSFSLLHLSFSHPRYKEERRQGRRASWRRSRIQRGIQPATSDKAKAHGGKRGPCVHRHIYPRLYRGPGVDSFLVLTCAIVYTSRSDRFLQIAAMDERKREKERPREAARRSPIAITTTPIPIIDTDTAPLGLASTFRHCFAVVSNLKRQWRRSARTRSNQGTDLGPVLGTNR